MGIDDKVIFKIYKPTKVATQSGLGNTSLWHLKIESSDSYYIDSLMGWVGSKDPRKQIVLKFDSFEKAVFYAKKRNVKYVIETPKNVKMLPKSYSDNFLLN
ncbi:NADH dehydrogenase ubiquinone Fe-S protein 4 [Wolbachia endosymbiont (group E) of Neria commutata]|uniref:NADH dehydrogenase ubiquinone Fe-S protein 4 n=1 Tax=Wolbachia endosymbiont (group E) of Neria commutata TaxID=3066149 RepID=UPI003132C8BE